MYQPTFHTGQFHQFFFGGLFAKLFWNINPDCLPVEYMALGMVNVYYLFSVTKEVVMSTCLMP